MSRPRDTIADVIAGVPPQRVILDRGRRGSGAILLMHSQIHDSFTG